MDITRSHPRRGVVPDRDGVYDLFDFRRRLCLLYRQESLGTHAEPGIGTADLGNHLPAFKQPHCWNRRARLEGRPISTIQVVYRRDRPAGPGIPAEHSSRMAALD